MTSVLVERERRTTASLPNSYTRIDGLERVSGRAKYAADWHLPDMLYGRIITSTIPHGIVKRINKEKLLAITGVEAVVTCFDDNTKWASGERLHERRIFADNPKFVGDCIGAVAAKTREAAEEATEQVEVEYDELPHVFTVEEALKPDAPKIWPNGNSFSVSFGFGDVKEAFERSDKIFEGSYKTARTHPAAIETVASLAWWDETGRLTVVASSQAVHNCRDGIAEDLGLPVEKVRVICLYKGGGFGNRNSEMNYDLIAARLSEKTRKPVMLEYSREQDFNGLHSRWSAMMELKAGVNTTDCILTALQLKGYTNLGAYTRRPLNIPNFLGTTSQDYFPASITEEYDVYTNTPSSGNVRAPAGPQANFAVETLIDEISYSLKMNPLDFRLRNVLERKRELDHHYTSSGLLDCFQEGAATFGWNKKWKTPPTRQKLLSGKSKWQGVGLAMSNWHSRLGRGEAKVTIRSDGKVQVAVGVVDIGTGAKSAMAVIASETLGVPIQDVEVVWGDSDTTPPEVGESGSRTTVFVGTAVKDACEKLNAKLIQISQPKRDVRSAELADIVRTYGENLVETSVTEPKLPEGKERACFAVHFAQVEVDTDTGKVSIQKYLAVHDSGKIVNRLTGESQVRGSVIMGIGMALSEELRINPDYGNFVNSNMMNYKIPIHMEIPRIEVKFVDTNDPYGPKSLGEVGLPPAIAAIGNAIFNATGIRLREIPFTPDRILLSDPNLLEVN